MTGSLAVFVLRCCLSVACLSPLASQAEQPADTALQIPLGAKVMARRETALGRYALPIGVYSAVAGIPLQQHEGRILRRTWQLRGDATVLQVLDLLRDQLQTLGYEILFQCTSRECGGFDFRFGIEVVPAPDMVVSLSDYQFLSVAKPEQGDTGAGLKTAKAASLLVSRSGNAIYVQLIEVGPTSVPPLAVAEPTSTSNSNPQEEQGLSMQLADLLRRDGRVVLKGVAFNTGALSLAEGALRDLAALAAFLRDEPEARVLLVGHTDTVGGLEDNKALSLRRASIVLEALVSQYNVDATRIQVAGAAFLAPISSNLTPSGRETNRRVEVVLIPE